VALRSGRSRLEPAPSLFSGVETRGESLYNARVCDNTSSTISRSTRETEEGTH
jgi:hypothetical protein